MVNVGVYIGFWAVLGVLGISVIMQSGASYSSFTCVTGEIVKSESECPQCRIDSDCQTIGKMDRQCNLQTNMCEAKTCFNLADCNDDGAICEFNKCVNEIELGEWQRAQLE